MAVRFKAAPKPPPAAATPSGDALFAQAVTLHGLGKLDSALELYERLLVQRPADAKLCELAGIALTQSGRPRDALDLLRRAVASDPENANAIFNLSVSFKQLDEIEQAIDAARAAVRLRPAYAEAQLHLGAMLEDRGRTGEALIAYVAAATAGVTSAADATEPAVASVQPASVNPAQRHAMAALRRMAAHPQWAAAVAEHLGAVASRIDPALRVVLSLARVQAAAVDAALSPRELLEKSDAARERGEHARAIQYLEIFLKREPANAAAWNNLGLAHRAAGDRPAALHAFRRATELDAGLALAWNNLGIGLMEDGDLTAAQRAFECALAADPALAQAHANLGMLFRRGHDAPSALASYQRALERDPELFEAHLNLGNLRYDFGDERGARAAYLEAAALRPEHPEALYSVGVTDPDPASAAGWFARALAARPGDAATEVAQVFAQLRACDWSDLDARLQRVEQMAQDPAAPALPPFWMLALSGSRQTQLLCARKWTRDRVLPAVPAQPPRLPTEQPQSASTVRVGLLSGDLRDHAVGQLLCDVLPRLGSRQCELWGYDVSPDDGSAARTTLRAAFHRVRDVATLGIPALGQRIQADGIDVLVDLSGYSQHSRSQVLGLRPAPVQVSYLGFPGSMGWEAVDYLIADDTLVPALHERDYDERIARLPVCYQPARHFHRSANDRPARQDAGLPEHGLVLASFGNPYKLRPEMFAVWLRVLASEPGSVLWLASFNRAMEDNLRAEARQRGIDPGRLVFAPMVSIDAHLARLPLADLCLDTAPYGSGVTATQALYAGVPLLTLSGATYVGRMAASLLHALEVPSLVAEDLADYERRALRLAGDDGLRRQLRAHLSHARESGVAYDVERSARDLEHLFLRLADSRRGAFKS